MTGAELRRIREDFELSHIDFGLLLGYTGSDRNIDFRIRKMEREERVPLHIGRYVWLINRYFIEHNGNLPGWPGYLRLEGDDDEEEGTG